MIKGLDTVTINSGDAKALANFYESKVGIKIEEEYEMGEGASAFEMAIGDGSAFYIVDKPEISGKSKDSGRTVVSFEVDDIDKAIEEMNNNGVTNIAEKFHIEGYGYLATYEDLDGNHFNLAQVKDSD
jgi:predicted enzyme related to lactoylglutathione lyase